MSTHPNQDAVWIERPEEAHWLCPDCWHRLSPTASRNSDERDSLYNAGPRPHRCTG